MKIITVKMLQLRHRIICGIAVTLIFSLFGTTPSSAKDSGTLRNFKRGDILPALSLPTLQKAGLASFPPELGKPGVIMFFSIRPDFRKKRSLALLSGLSDLKNNYKNRINVVAVYSDDKEEEIVKSYMATSSIDLMVLKDDRKSVYNKYGVFMMPLVILTNEEGKLHEVIPYTFNIKEVIDGNIKMLLGDWSADELSNSLKPKETFIKTEEEKEYIRRINYGKIMLSKKMYPQAIREFSTATKLMPKMIGAHLELGFSYISAKDFDASEKVFKEALLIDPDSDDAISGLGLSYYGRGMIDEALERLESAFITIKPRLEVIIALADIYEQKGNNNKANRLNKLAVDRLMTLYEQRWK